MRIELDIDYRTYRSLGIGYLLVLLVAAGFGVLTGASLAVTGVAIVVGLLILPALCVPLFVSVLLHELGHAVAAIGLGLRVRAIKVYGVYFLFAEAPMPKGARSTGFADLEPQLRRDKPWSATLISLAGPAVDIAVALGCYTLLRHSQEVTPWGAFLRVLGVASAWNAVASLTPRESDPLGNDLGQIKDFWKPRSQIFAVNALHRIWPMYDGADPSGFDSEDVRRALWVEDPGHEISAIQLATYHAIATRSPNAAELADGFVAKCEKAYDDTSDEEVRSAWRTVLEDALLESAFVWVLFARDIAASEARSERLDWLSKDCYHTARRLYAAQLLAKGDLDGARRQIENAKLALRQAEASDPRAAWSTPRRFLALVEERLLATE